MRNNFVIAPPVFPRHNSADQHVITNTRRWIFALSSAIMLRYLKFIKLSLSLSLSSISLAIMPARCVRYFYFARKRERAPVEKLCERMLLFNSLFFTESRASFFAQTALADSKLAANERFLGLRDRRTRAITNFRLIQRNSVCLIRFIQSSLRPSGEPHPQEFPVATCQPRVTQC